MDADHEVRVRAVRAAMAARGIDTLVVAALENVYYLTGFQTPGCPVQALVVTPRTLDIVTRRLEASNVEHRTHGVGCVPYDATDDGATVLARAVVAAPGATVGAELDALAHPVACRLLARCPVVDASDLVRGLRLVKTPAEVAHATHAARCVAVGLCAAVAALRYGYQIANAFPGEEVAIRDLWVAHVLPHAVVR